MKMNYLLILFGTLFLVFGNVFLMLRKETEPLAIIIIGCGIMCFSYSLARYSISRRIRETVENNKKKSFNHP